MDTDADLKPVLKRYLDRGREAILWKLDGLSEYDVRRPMVDSGTNLLGLVKHLTYGEAWYFGNCFGRPFEDYVDDWETNPEPNHDMYAREDESRELIVDRFHRACAHADATIQALPLDAVGHVPWWTGRYGPEASLGWLMVHVATETHRHAGHADILRELIDGQAGVSAQNPNLPDVSPGFWQAYRGRLEQIARSAS
ncbi:MAG TPA: DinB family protein [Mycobacteriales bacterium]|nr:DinB family protein [Mycobacteriales bacterium]